MVRKTILHSATQNKQMATPLKMNIFADHLLLWRAQLANNVKVRSLC